ncbi:MAG: hypothetical protein LYZ69_07560 [Nitrososphaerales archaeon]|nr:hypothetical protein [Nitrososphaerales archaeon]
MLSDDEIRASILFKLHRRGNWGASHTAFDNLQKGFKDTDLGKHEAKRIDRMARELIRQGWIIPKPTSYSLQVSLNPRDSEQITSLMRRFFPDV